MKAIVIGGTGATGKALVKALCADVRYKEVVLLLRREVSYTDTKIRAYTVNFDDTSSYIPYLQGDVLYSVMGTTIKIAKTKENQYKVDYSYQYEVAKHASKQGVMNYVLLSSVGASKTSSSFYLKIKGELEEAVKLLSFKQIKVLRPSILDREGAVDFRLAERLSLYGMKVLKYLPFLNRYQPITVKRLAQALIYANDSKSDKKYEVLELLPILKLTQPY